MNPLRGVYWFLRKVHLLNRLYSFFYLILLSFSLLCVITEPIVIIYKDLGACHSARRDLGKKEVSKVRNIFPKMGIHAAFNALRQFPKVLDTIWTTAKQSSYGVCGIQRIDVDGRRCEVQFHDMKVRIGLISGKTLT